MLEETKQTETDDPYFDVIVTYDNGPQDFFDLPTTPDRMHSDAATLEDILASIERTHEVVKISVCLHIQSETQVPAWLLTNGGGKWYFSTNEYS